MEVAPQRPRPHVKEHALLGTTATLGRRPAAASRAQGANTARQPDWARHSAAGPSARVATEMQLPKRRRAPRSVLQVDLEHLRRRRRHAQALVPRVSTALSALRPHQEAPALDNVGPFRDTALKAVHHSSHPLLEHIPSAGQPMGQHAPVSLCARRAPTAQVVTNTTALPAVTALAQGWQRLCAQEHARLASTVQLARSPLDRKSAAMPTNTAPRALQLRGPSPRVITLRRSLLLWPGAPASNNAHRTRSARMGSGTTDSSGRVGAPGRPTRVPL